MESTPVVGVDMRKERTAPLVAPSLLSVIAAGMTLHEQRGRGIPNKAAFTTEKILFFPKCALTVLVSIKICSMPAKRNPKRRYGDILLSRKYASLSTPKIIVI
jgi:hypothetical protein